jgi:hypothetical protein
MRDAYARSLICHCEWATDMIHKVSVVILAALSLLCAVLFVIGFSNEHGAIRDIVDGRDTVVVARAYRGSLMFFVGRMNVAFDEATEKLYAEDPDIFKGVRAYRRQLMLQFALPDPCFRGSSNATRFGCKLPSWNARNRTGATSQFGFFVFPIWGAFLLFAAYPIFAMFRGPMRRRRRQARNECVHCGYSLIGLVEPRCPECGGANVLRIVNDDLIEEPISNGGPEEGQDIGRFNGANN